MLSALLNEARIMCRCVSGMRYRYARTWPGIADDDFGVEMPGECLDDSGSQSGLGLG